MESSSVRKGLHLRRSKRCCVEFYLDTNSTWKYHETDRASLNHVQIQPNFKLIGQRFLQLHTMTLEDGRSVC